MKSAIWINVALGLWLIFAPWALGYGSPTARTEDVVFGAGVILVSLWIAGSSLAGAAALWTLVVFAVWIFIAPWVLGYAGYALVNDVVVAIVLFVVTVSLLERTGAPVGDPGGRFA